MGVYERVSVFQPSYKLEHWRSAKEPDNGIMIILCLAGPGSGKGFKAIYNIPILSMVIF